MKSVFKHGGRLLVLAGTAFGTWVGAMPGMLALSPDEIVQELSGVPIFQFVDAEGKTLSISVTPPDAEDATNGEPQAEGGTTGETTDNFVFTEIFISHEDAESYLASIPQLVDSYQVAPVSLAAIYAVSLQPQPENIQQEFLVTAMSDSLSYAASLLPEGEEIQGVPLFRVWTPAAGEDAATAETDGENQEIITLQLDDGREPLFFSKAQIDETLAELENSDEFSENLRVGVVWLNNYIQYLEVTDQEDLEFSIVPLQQSVSFAESFRLNGNGSPAPTN